MENNRKILTIEALRGFAAIYVMLGHIVLLMQPYVYFPQYKFWVKTMFGYGHQAVILFFIVSGFSIHYSSLFLNFSKSKSVKDYFFKRFRRIYPLFIISLIVSLVVLWLTNMESTLYRNVASFFMVTDISEGAISEPIPTNFPIWSLSYEVVYYLLYPLAAIFIHKWGIKKLVIISFLLSLLFSVFTVLGYANHVSNVMQLYWVWLVGAWLAELKVRNSAIEIPYIKGLLILSIAAMLTLEKALFFSDWFWAMFFSLLMLSFSIKQFSKTTIYKLVEFSIGLGAVAVCYLITYNTTIVFHTQLIRIILFCLALGMVFMLFVPFVSIQNLLRKLLSPFVKAGGFSYAVYIFHWPLMLLFLKFFQVYINQSIWIMSAGILFYIAIVLFVAWLLEIKLQPIMASQLNKIYYSNHLVREKH